MNRRPQRTLRLAGGLVRRTPGRFVLVVLLLSVCVLVFLAVQALAAASGENLDEAVAAELGLTGQYTVEVEPGLGLSRAEQDRLVEATLGQYTQEPITTVERLGELPLDCTPDGDVGDLPLLVLRDAAGIPLHVSPAEASSPGSYCLAGLDISSDARPTAAGEQRTLGKAVVIDPSVSSLARLANSRPPSTTYLIVTGEARDLATRLTRSVTSALTPAAALAAVEPRELVNVSRVDDGDLVRRAAQGVQIVYGLIAWAILLIGAVGVAIAEMANVRERTWLLGLGRSMGATRTDIAALVILDAVLVLVAAALVSAVAMVGLNPLARSFGQSAFQVDLNLLDPTLLPQLALGAAAILLIGAALPARRAAHLDPVDTLERR